jgi:hypothetical protein
MSRQLRNHLTQRHPAPSDPLGFSDLLASSFDSLDLNDTDGVAESAPTATAHATPSISSLLGLRPASAPTALPRPRQSTVNYYDESTFRWSEASSTSALLGKINFSTLIDFSNLEGELFFVCLSINKKETEKKLSEFYQLPLTDNLPPLSNLQDCIDWIRSIVIGLYAYYDEHRALNSSSKENRALKHYLAYLLTELKKLMPLELAYFKTIKPNMICAELRNILSMRFALLLSVMKASAILNDVPNLLFSVEFMDRMFHQLSKTAEVIKIDLTLLATDFHKRFNKYCTFSLVTIAREIDRLTTHGNFKEAVELCYVRTSVSNPTFCDARARLISRLHQWALSAYAVDVDVYRKRYYKLLSLQPNSTFAEHFYTTQFQENCARLSILHIGNHFSTYKAYIYHFEIFLKQIAAMTDKQYHAHLDKITLFTFFYFPALCKRANNATLVDQAEISQRFLKSIKSLLTRGYFNEVYELLMRIVDNINGADAIRFSRHMLKDAMWTYFEAEVQRCNTDRVLALRDQFVFEEETETGFGRLLTFEEVDRYCNNGTALAEFTDAILMHHQQHGNGIKISISPLFMACFIASPFAMLGELAYTIHKIPAQDRRTLLATLENVTRDFIRRPLSDVGFYRTIRVVESRSNQRSLNTVQKTL